ncbi:MAG: hypothetical protein WCL32_22470, partial [Planctomycetota bacterium]
MATAVGGSVLFGVRRDRRFEGPQRFFPDEQDDELAACLLGTLGLPLPVLEAVAWHHAPSRSEDEGFSLLT